MTDVTDNVHEETLSIEIPLDDAHTEIVEALNESNIDVEATLSKQLQQNAEMQLYSLYQEGKYGSQ